MLFRSNRKLTGTAELLLTYAAGRSDEGAWLASEAMPGVLASAVLARKEMLLGDVLSMAVGEIIPIEIVDPVTVYVDGLPVIRGKYGVKNGRYAVRVQSIQRPEEYLKAARIPLDWAARVTFMKGKGCDKCGGSGYKGRTGVYEVLRNTTAVRKAIMAAVGTDELRAIASAEGTLTLREDGLKKVERGATTLDEVVKETTAVD